MASRENIHTCEPRTKSIQYAIRPAQESGNKEKCRTSVERNSNKLEIRMKDHSSVTNSEKLQLGTIVYTEAHVWAEAR